MTIPATIKGELEFWEKHRLAAFRPARHPASGRSPTASSTGLGNSWGQRPTQSATSSKHLAKPLPVNPLHPLVFLIMERENTVPHLISEGLSFNTISELFPNCLPALPPRLPYTLKRFLPAVLHTRAERKLSKKAFTGLRERDVLTQASC